MCKNFESSINYIIICVQSSHFRFIIHIFFKLYDHYLKWLIIFSYPRSKKIHVEFMKKRLSEMAKNYFLRWKPVFSIKTQWLWSMKRVTQWKKGDKNPDIFCKNRYFCFKVDSFSCKINIIHTECILIYTVELVKTESQCKD